MDTNPAGGPRNGPPGNMTMRPPPSPGNGTMNPNVRPSFPNQRPPPQQLQQQQQQQQQPGGNPTGRAPITSPFQRQDPASGQPSVPMNPNVRPLQHQAPGNPSSPVRPPGTVPGGVSPQRPMQQQQQQQQQPRPQPPTPAGQHPSQFAGQGRLPGASFNNGSQSPLRGGLNSPQSQHSMAMRPPHMQPGQQQSHVNGANIRPSASHPNVTGGVPGIPPGNRMTPPSPSLSTRSPQIRPLQQNQQTPGSGPSPQHHPPQQPPQHHQPSMRPSMSHPHLAQQAGVRPPSAQGSPVLVHQTAVRPPTPLMQHQPRPRPPQGGPHGQPPSPFTQTQHGALGQAVQLDMPSMNGEQPTNGAPSPQQRPHLQPSQDMHQQQRSPGARPILDQMRQQTQPSHPGQGAGSPQNPQHLNPAHRPPQRPTGPSQPQPPRQQQAPGSVPLSPNGPPTKEAHSSSPPTHGHDDQLFDPKPIQGEHGRVPNASPQQHNTHAANQRPANPQAAPGARPHPQQGPPGPAGFSGPHHAPRPLQAPGSPAQRPLGFAEIKLPGPSPNMASRPPPAPQQHYRPQQQQQQEQKPQALQPSVTLVEPDAPLSDSEGAYDDEDDIEGGGTKSTPPKSPSAQDVAPPHAKSAAGGPPQGPPVGPPRGPPKAEGHGARKLSGAAGTGPVHIMQPSNNPTSPPASAFPALGQPKPRVRPPPGNANHTPYRPPERPSQAPVMYSQFGQPTTFSQPFPAQGDKDASPAKSMISQGADATSSSIRPREGNLQKRVVASDSNTTKSDSPGSQLPSPPSPKLHGLKGPAILSVSNHRSSSSSKVKSLKTWAIRGGLTYLGYTAIFNCPPETTGVKGLYCKTTNGIGGLVKPFVAPHYNAHVGPHVDRYIAPVARQGHRIYIKVADPVVQGVFSAASTVYKSTAKKHVDSAKEQVISILPYPFKPKSKAADKEAEEVLSDTEQEKPHIDRISRQPVHVEELAHASESVEETAVHDEGVVEETYTEKAADVVEHAPEAIVEQAEPIAEMVQEVVEEMKESPEEPVAIDKEISKEAGGIKQDEVTGIEEGTNTAEADEQEPAKNEASEGSIYGKMAALKASSKGLREDVKESEQPEKQEQQQAEEAPEANVTEATESQVPTDATPEDTAVPTVEEESIEPTAESTVEFADKPTVLAEESETAPVETAEAAAEAAVETPAVILEEAVVPEAVVPEAVKSPVAEEETREALPKVTEAVVDDAVVPESSQSQQHTEQHSEGEKVEDDSGPTEVETEVEAKAEVADDGEKIAEVKEEGEATFEQQAAPVSSSKEEAVEGEAAGHNGHDEL
ncbi:hypothetical protein BGW39_005860 [Mortierella sp. 14UC]|nr:hypothetical protein BGW39_005860 [Mortierella sp. 14UC]